MNTFRIKNWRKYQKYKDRKPTWILVQTSIRNDFNFNAAMLGHPPVTDEEMGQIIGIFCLAAEQDDPKNLPDGPELPLDPKAIKKLAGLSSEPNLDRLVNLCVIVCTNPYQSVPICTSETETETETETEKTPPISPPGGSPVKRKRKSKYTPEVQACAQAAVDAFNSHFGTSRTANSGVLQAVKVALGQCPDAKPEDFRAVVADRVNEDWVKPGKTVIASLIRGKDFAAHVERVKEVVRPQEELPSFEDRIAQEFGLEENTHGVQAESDDRNGMEKIRRFVEGIGRSCNSQQDGGN